VSTLLQETLQAVDEAFPVAAEGVDILDAMPPRWREQVAEEVWTAISSGIAPTPDWRSDSSEIPTVLPALMPLRVRLRCAAKRAQVRPRSQEEEAPVIARSASSTCPILADSPAICSSPSSRLGADASAKPQARCRGVWDRLPNKQVDLADASATALLHTSGAKHDADPALASALALFRTCTSRKENSRDAPPLARHTSCLEAIPAGAGQAERGALRFPR